MSALAAVPDSRTRILEATAQCIADDGLSAVRMAGIARAAGVSTALLHYHFETKEHLFEQVLRHSYESSTILDQETLRQVGLTPAQRLATYLNRCLPSDSTLRRDLLLWQEFGAMSPRHPGMALVTADLFQGDVDRVARIIRDGVADGSFRCDEPELVARAAIALCDGLSTRVLCDDPRTSIVEARRIVSVTIGSLVGTLEHLPLVTEEMLPPTSRPARTHPLPSREAHR